MATVSDTTHQKVFDLLDGESASSTFNYVYDRHQTANMLLPSLSIEVNFETPIESDAAITAQELVDNKLCQLSIKVHTAYRLGYTDIETARVIVDEVITILRTNIDLSDGYRIFNVSGIVYNVEHGESATSGAELTVNVHKVVYYEQE